MTPLKSARLPGRPLATFLTVFFAAASAAALAAAALPAAAAQEADSAGDTANAAELNWARDALARNGALEVVSTDAAAGTIGAGDVAARSLGLERRTRCLDCRPLCRAAIADRDLDTGLLAGGSDRLDVDQRLLELTRRARGSAFSAG